MPETITATRIIDLDLWEGRLPKLVEGYRNAKPFPHTVMDGFLDVASATQAQQAFPRVQDQGWIHYVHVNEKKHGLNKMDRLPPYLREVIQKLNSAGSSSILPGIHLCGRSTSPHPIMWNTWPLRACSRSPRCSGARRTNATKPASSGDWRKSSRRWTP